MHADNQSFFVKQPEVVGIMKNLAEVAKVVTRDMAAAGVGILTGCDTMIAGFCAHDELALMVAGGMTPHAALQTATINPARYLGREIRSGLSQLENRPTSCCWTGTRSRTSPTSAAFVPS